jgi:hypothetical protein
MRPKRHMNLLLVFFLSSLLLLWQGKVPVSAIYNGISALGSNYVIGINIGGSSSCSAVPIDRYLIVTAAHCVIKDGRAVDPGSIGIYPPGVNRSTVSTFAKGVYIAYPSNYYNYDSSTEPNDIAFIVIDRPFEINSFPRLANYEKSIEIINSTTPIKIYGYGVSERNGPSVSIPNMFTATSIPQRRYSGFSGYERTYMSFAADSRGSACPGDSGGPAISEHKGIIYLVGVTSGGSGPCSNGSTSGSMSVTVVGEYTHLLSKANDFIVSQKPSTVTILSLSNVGEIGNLRWASKDEDARKIIGYSVLDENGVEICRTSSNATFCEVSVRPGNNLFKVISLGKFLNSDPALPTFSIGLPAPLNPKITRLGLMGTVSWDPPAVFTKFVDYFTVKNSQGEEVCKTSLNTCGVTLSTGSNALFIFAHYKDTKSPQAEITVFLRNAQPPVLENIKVFRNILEIEWAQITELGDANTTNLRILIKDAESGEEFCTEFYSKKSCLVPLLDREYRFTIYLNTDLGSTNAESALPFSGSKQILLNEALISLIDSLKGSLIGLSKKSPGYIKEIKSVQIQTPVVSSETVFNDSLIKSVQIFENKVSFLTNTIKKKPKNITITCSKGNILKKLIGVNPKCPLGYKQK